MFAEASILIGFVFPGETAVILGGVAASRGHINIVALIVVVVICAIAGDSVGYLVGQTVGTPAPRDPVAAPAATLLDRVLDQLNRRGAIAVFVARFTAFLRAVVPGLAGMSSMPYRVFLPANAAGGVVWGTAYCLLGYVVGQRYTKLEHARASRPTCCWASSWPRHRRLRRPAAAQGDGELQRRTDATGRTVARTLTPGSPRAPTDPPP